MTVRDLRSSPGATVMALEVENNSETFFQILSRTTAETDTFSLKSTQSTEKSNYFVAGNS